MSMKNKYIGILLIGIAMLLNACSSDDSGAPQTVSTGNEPVGKVVQLVSYASSFTEKELSHRAVPAGFSAFTPDKTTSMGIYMLLSENPATDWASPEEKKIIYTNKWHAYFDVQPGKTYTVYGYMPKIGDMSSSLAKSTAGAATLTIRKMKPVTNDDICIITGVKETDEGLKEGQFSWSWPIPSSEEENYKIYILMDHLYAAAQFRLRISSDYALLRTIKLKTMTLSTDKGSVNATITLTHNDTGASPISNVEFAASGSSDAVVIFNSDEGVALDKTTPLSINACFVPTLSANLTLTSTYDVYDSKGNLIRQNCTATNKLPNLEANRGQRVQVNMLVNPTYLNVLSDPDLNNPTITIGN
jgi:hypothetical protein